MGVIFASFFENVYILKIKANTHRLLSVAIIGLGASVNIQSIIQVGLSGVGYTFIGITFTLLLGLLLGKLLKLNKAQTLLISSGTAICGGSAIAAVSSTLQAKNEDTAVALAVVFVLNAVSLWVFPYLGHYFGLSQEQFGLWSALAIHDTSSVVGAGMQYGERADSECAHEFAERWAQDSRRRAVGGRGQAFQNSRGKGRGVRKHRGGIRERPTRHRSSDGRGAEITERFVRGQAAVGGAGVRIEHVSAPDRVGV
jgi:hypothetical protein